MPSVVLAAFAGDGLVIDLFESPYPNITDIQVAGLLLKGEAPTDAQPQSPNLTAVAGGLSKWIAGGGRCEQRNIGSRCGDTLGQPS